VVVLRVRGVYRVRAWSYQDSGCGIRIACGGYLAWLKRSLAYGLARTLGSLLPLCNKGLLILPLKSMLIPTIAPERRGNTTARHRRSQS
jgi:hypothetical protein